METKKKHTKFSRIYLINNHISHFMRTKINTFEYPNVNIFPPKKQKSTLIRNWQKVNFAAN